MEPKENFMRNWEDYKVGFGDFDREFWLGKYLKKCIKLIEFTHLLITKAILLTQHSLTLEVSFYFNSSNSM